MPSAESRVPSLTWGILSTANIGRAAVMPAIRASANGTLVAVASRTSARALEFATTHGIPEHYGSYDALLGAAGIDAVYIPLPNSLHREWAIKAVEHGKHVLCEKPLGLTAAECHEMAAAAKANGVTLMEAFMYRFHPQIGRVEGLIRDGTLGALKSIRSAFTFRLTKPGNIRLDPALGGGALMDVGCYCVNVSRTLAGREPVEAQAWATFGPTGVDLELAGSLRFDGGLVAQFDCSLTMERREFVEIAGTEGSIELRAAFVPGTADAVVIQHRGREPSIEHRIAGDDEYRLMVEHFADGALHRRPVRYPADEAAANLRVIEALYRSTRQGGRPMTL